MQIDEFLLPGVVLPTRGGFAVKQDEILCVETAVPPLLDDDADLFPHHGRAPRLLRQRFPSAVRHAQVGRIHTGKGKSRRLQVGPGDPVDPLFAHPNAQKLRPIILERRPGRPPHPGPPPLSSLLVVDQRLLQKRLSPAIPPLSPLAPSPSGKMQLYHHPLENLQRTVRRPPRRKAEFHDPLIAHQSLFAQKNRPGNPLLSLDSEQFRLRRLQTTAGLDHLKAHLSLCRQPHQPALPGERLSLVSPSFVLQAQRTRIALQHPQIGGHGPGNQRDDHRYCNSDASGFFHIDLQMITLNIVELYTPARHWKSACWRKRSIEMREKRLWPTGERNTIPGLGKKRSCDRRVKDPGSASMRSP